MTKPELENKVKYLESELDYLNAAFDRLNEAYYVLENENYELSNNNIYGIRDLDNLRFRMQSEGLWTDEFEAFLEDYLRFHNNQ